MAEPRSCLARLGLVATFVVPILAADGLLALLWLFPSLSTLLVYVTMGLGLLPLVALPTPVLYAHALWATLVARALGLRPWAAGLLGGALFATIGLGPGLASRAAHALALRDVPPSFGAAPPPAPRQLRWRTSSPRCTDLCMELLFGGDLDALELHVATGRDAGSTVLRRVDAQPCPPWPLAQAPRGLSAFERSGRCLAVEVGGTLDAPWIEWTEHDRRGGVLTWGVGAAPDGRAAFVDRRPIALPTRFTLDAFATLALARDDHGRAEALPHVLREVIGYALPGLGVPLDPPAAIVRYALAKPGPLRDDERDEVASALGRVVYEDPTLLGEVLADDRFHGVFGGLERVARDEPGLVAGQVAPLLALLEDPARPQRDREHVAEVLSRLRPTDLAPHHARILASTQTPPPQGPPWPEAPLLRVVGRLGVDPASVLGPALASPREEVFIEATAGLCNADPRWAAPHLDDAERALLARHSDKATLRLARALVRFGRAAAVDAALQGRAEGDALRLRRDLDRSWDDPVGGCWP